MNEIYWITRCDSINILFTILMVFGIAISIVTAIVYFVTNGQAIRDKSRGYESSAKEQEGYKQTCRNLLKYCIPLTTLFCLITVFVPTTKQALLIYGVGGTVDYIKNNPTAKQLPDKCIVALDKWVDSLGSEKSDTIK